MQRVPSVWRKCSLSLHLVQRDDIRFLAMEEMQPDRRTPGGRRAPSSRPMAAER
jgi:hypothetical protein